ncbi:MAG: hypothetical protein ACR2RB_05910 [Gammaproteobacteria bacterium]
MNVRKTSWLIAAFTLSLAACGSDNDPPVNGGSGGGTPPAQATFSQFASQDANAEPLDISDPAALAADIAAIFGDANDEPVEVEEGDDLNAVIARAN